MAGPEKHTEKHVASILCMPCLARDHDVQVCSLQQASRLTDENVRHALPLRRCSAPDRHG